MQQFDSPELLEVQARAELKARCNWMMRVEKMAFRVVGPTLLVDFTLGATPINAAAVQERVQRGHMLKAMLLHFYGTAFKIVQEEGNARWMMAWKFTVAFDLDQLPELHHKQGATERSHSARVFDPKEMEAVLFFNRNGEKEIAVVTHQSGKGSAPFGPCIGLVRPTTGGRIHEVPVVVVMGVLNIEQHIKEWAQGVEWPR